MRQTPHGTRDADLNPLLSFTYGKLADSGLHGRPRDPVDAHVGGQHIGNHDRSVSLLIVFHHRDPGPAHGETGAVQGVHELAFPAALRLVADAGAPGLERLTVRTGGDLPELVPRG